MGGQRDFASLLDDLFVPRDAPADAAPRPTIPFDYLAVAEELHSGRIRVASDAVEAEYREAGSSLEAELADLLGQAEALAGAAAALAGSDAEDLPPVEPEAIAAELGLNTAGAADLGKLRRTFASKNHPDRVAPHLRQRALLRMQVANVLIDDARRKALAMTRR